MNNYFLNLQKNIEDQNSQNKNKKKEKIELVNQQDILNKKNQDLLKLKKENEKFQYQNNIDKEKEYTLVIEQILLDLSKLRYQGEVVFFSGAKIHLKILQHRLYQLGYSISMMVYPRYHDYCIDWKLNDLGIETESKGKKLK